jgi:uncharacterized protein
MSLSLHDIAVPVIRQMLGNLSGWLDKAEAHAKARHFDAQVYMTLRLAPDMLPFPKQIQIASDSAKGCIARLGGVEIPRWVDDEATLADLKTRIVRTLEFVDSVPASGFDDAEARTIEVPTRHGGPLKFDGRSYLLHFALPNLYFHTTTAYALLRQAGVDIGKGDYLGTRR